MRLRQCRRHVGVLLTCFSPDISSEFRLCRYQDLVFTMVEYGVEKKHFKVCIHTSEWIDRYQDSANVCIDFRVSPPLLEIVIDAFVADRGKQGHI